ncbi:MAG: hypothetical protein ACJ8M1_05425 [Chthoniobacterales bacterium]
MDDRNNHAGNRVIDATAAPVVVMKYGNKVAIVRYTIRPSPATPDGQANFRHCNTKRDGFDGESVGDLTPPAR